MKWLLITTIGRNPGDEFARLGVQRIIQELDKNAEFELIDKETEHTPWRRRDFDRCVICGMPAFWDNEISNNSEIWWWDEIFARWPSENASKIAAIGIGDTFSKPPISKDRFERSLAQLSKKTSFATVRANIPYAEPRYADRYIQSVCPASFVNFGATVDKDLKLFNLMPKGAHDEHFNPEESAIFVSKSKSFADMMIDRGYRFIAHNEAGGEFCRTLGHEPLHPKTIQEYVDLYARCSEYVGTRMHGAVITLGGGGKAAVIGYDSRVDMVKRLGGNVYKPSDNLTEIELGDPNLAIVESEYNKMVFLLKNFMR